MPRHEGYLSKRSELAYSSALLRYLGDTEEGFWQKREAYYREGASMAKAEKADAGAI